MSAWLDINDDWSKTLWQHNMHRGIIFVVRDWGDGSVAMLQWHSWGIQYFDTATKSVTKSFIQRNYTRHG